MICFTVASAEAKRRLDVFLSVRLGVSRSRVQKLLKEGKATHAGKPAIAHHLVAEGQEIVLTKEPAEILKKKRKILPKLDIVFENDDVMVVNKPAGLLVHANSDNEIKPTLAEMAVKHFPKMKNVGENPLRPGIVHRLDKDVSGLMVIAKTQEAFESLKAQFASHETEKHYVALAYGRILRPHDIITLKISRSKKRGRMVARPESQEGKEAITEYIVKQLFKTATLLDIRTHTGRTHQIRTHFFALNHPLVGDELYKKSRMRHIRHIPLGRVFLHAAKLGFKLPDGRPMMFEAPLPPELEMALVAMPPL